MMKYNKEGRAKKIRSWVKTILATIAIIIVFISAILFAPLLVTLIKGYFLEAEDKYEFFRDILFINLSIMAVLFAAIVFWIHLFIIESVKNAVEKPLEERDVSFSHYIQGLTLLNNGYSCWLTYVTTGDEKLLDAAIAQTELAYYHVEMLTDENSDYILIKCQTRNNLGYYLAARGKFEDKAEAIAYANYIKKRIGNYPEHRTDWLETHNYIMSKKWEITVPQDL